MIDSVDNFFQLAQQAEKKAGLIKKETQLFTVELPRMPGLHLNYLKSILKRTSD